MAVSVHGEIHKHNALKRTTFASSFTFHESLHSALLICKTGSNLSHRKRSKNRI